MKNEYYIDGDVIYVKLNRRNGDILWTMVSLNKLNMLNDYHGKIYAWWCKETNSFYARLNINKGGKQTTTPLHQYLTNYSFKVIDHRDHNTLNNCDNNLYGTTQKENCQNSAKRCNNKSGYKGVCWHKHAKKWFARITVNGNKIILGYFDDLIMAAKAYDDAVFKYFTNITEYSLNFPKQNLEVVA